MADKRMTSQRIKILDYLKGVKSHPTADMVYEAVRKDLPAISLATVYRNLNLLTEQGDILRFEVNGEYRFDADLCHHQHFVCRRCNKIFDFFQKDISLYAMKQFKVKGFRPECVSIIFKGRCKDCNAGRD